MTKKSKSKTPLPRLSLAKKTLWLFSVATVILLFSYLAFLSYHKDKIFPGVKISSFYIGGQTTNLAYQVLTKEFKDRTDTLLQLTANEQKFEVDLIAPSAQIDLEAKIKLAYSIGRSGDVLKDLKDQLSLLIIGQGLELELTYQNATNLSSQLEKIATLIKTAPEDAVLVFENPIIIQPSKQGLGLDTKTLNAQIESYLSLKTLSPVNLPTTVLDPEFTTQSAQKSKDILESIRDKPIILSYNDQKWEINQPTLYSLLNFKSDNLLDQERLENYLKSISLKINRPMKNPRFQVNSSSYKPVVTEFQTAQVGQELNIEQTKSLINQSLINKTRQITLPVNTIPPSIETADTNNLGIESLLAQGTSHFAGSIENRIYNLKLAASRINGVLIAPNEVFSWNQTVGDISASTGYKQAYVIKSGRTVLDDGGGVCQTSTTLFRAVLNAGLPILNRTAHAYRVGYYEQDSPPGIDATIFYPTVDFKFKNDTGKHILIQARSSGYSLYVDLYGTFDGRSVELTKPTVVNQTPPPPELRQEDPSLPKGTIKQIDWAAWGAQVSFKRTVTKSGAKMIDETFYSNYKPWQAVYLVGTQ
ncbi:hypothetical protein A3H85_03685 [Candidatus Daviesbacteria bacterium RIFCSPLOWO2_02_FULL_40_8]|nr:MAG: hypothetical protein A3C32_00645 [Candidatus Daviesbacteria bacterium RIFCSPHIGHO2_02_FULL_41_14]OGE66504.1 MAG: hypothetical protein A3H85_03685 [Candidatus Daviesbacteria bacterium RIFCSPLOWO2_02_FULL_40_8]